MTSQREPTPNAIASCARVNKRAGGRASTLRLDAFPNDPESDAAMPSGYQHTTATREGDYSQRQERLAAECSHDHVAVNTFP
ncbi:hypothetical protein ACOMHN_002021 [Nucella lapillus]